jgi:hypothetical protein
LDIDGWLRSLGLGQYAAAFRDNAIDEKVLPRLTAKDLKDLGVGLVTAACCSTQSLRCAVTRTQKSRYLKLSRMRLLRHKRSRRHPLWRPAS